MKDRVHHRWTPERDAQLEELWNAGDSAVEIAKRMFTTPGSIMDRRNLLDLPKRKNPGGWSEPQIATLRKLWQEGKSAAEIAAVIPGKSRNACIGKVHRLGLSDAGRAKPGPARTYAPRIKAPKVARSPVAPPKPGPQNKPGAVFGSYKHEPDFAKAEILRAKKTEAGVKKVASVTAGAGVESPNAVPLLDYVRGCKWPLGERGAVHYCCNPVAGGGGWGDRYCSGHRDLAVAEKQPDRIRPREAVRLSRHDRADRAPKTAPDYVWDMARAAA